MPVDDSIVQTHINAALIGASALTGTSTTSVICPTTTSTSGDVFAGRCDAIGAAFRHLKSLRQVPGASLDMDLAAAEHYMFARWMVCSGTVSPTQMRGMVIGYDAKKGYDQLTGDPDAERVTSNPVSPPDRDVIRWGLQGVADGSKDQSQCSVKVKPPVFRPMKDVFGKEVYGPY